MKRIKVKLEVVTAAKAITLILAFGCTLAIMDACSKKDTPAPTSSTTSGSSTSGSSTSGSSTSGSSTSGSSTSGSSTSGSSTSGATGTPQTSTLTVSGSVAETLSVNSGSNSSGYAIAGSSTGTYSTLGATFSSQPQSSSTVTLGITSNPNLTILSSSDEWIAGSGTATVTVSNGVITVTFSNVTFTSPITSTSITASGTLSVLASSGSSTSGSSTSGSSTSGSSTSGSSTSGSSTSGSSTSGSSTSGSSTSGSSTSGSSTSGSSPSGSTTSSTSCPTGGNTFTAGGVTATGSDLTIDANNSQGYVVTFTTQYWITKISFSSVSGANSDYSLADGTSTPGAGQATISMTNQFNGAVYNSTAGSGSVSACSLSGVTTVSWTNISLTGSSGSEGTSGFASIQ